MHELHREICVARKFNFPRSALREIKGDKRTRFILFCLNMEHFSDGNDLEENFCWNSGKKENSSRNEIVRSSTAQ